MDNLSAEDRARQAADALNSAAEIQREAKRGDKKVWMPNAIGVNPRPFVEARRKMHKEQNDVFAHAERLLKRPEPGYHYAWAKQNMPSTVNRAAAGQYRYVKPEEIKAELAQMFVTHKGTTGNTVCHGSLVLVAIPPKAWIELYIEPEIESVARLATQEEYFQAQIEQESQGTAQGTVERKIEQGISGE